ncbi:MAG: hypothetical protein GWO24_25880, partial [Akkermansiaceae bacterium]|nr:hypothetical protein [Akkermansiaceae bacterium]
KDIRKSLEDAEKIRAQMAGMEETQRKLLAETEDQAKQILADARKGAGEAARTIEEK